MLTRSMKKASIRNENINYENNNHGSINFKGEIKGDRETSINYGNNTHGIINFKGEIKGDKGDPEMELKTEELKMQMKDKVKMKRTPVLRQEQKDPEQKPAAKETAADDRTEDPERFIKPWLIYQAYMDVLKQWPRETRQISINEVMKRLNMKYQMTLL